MRIDWKPKGGQPGIDTGQWRCFEDEADWAGHDNEVVARLDPPLVTLPDFRWELRIIPASPNSHGWLMAPGVSVAEFLEKLEK